MFVRIIWVRKGTPFYHTAPSIDLDERTGVCRTCPKSRIFRFLFWGIVVGSWQESEMTEEDSLKEFLRCGLNTTPAVWGELSGVAPGSHAGAVSTHSN